jgi:serine/threonine-protein kinase
MERRLGNRYAISGLVQTMTLGQLYKADDLSLNRSVLLYELDGSRETARSREALLRAASFSHDAFMHILDIGISQESSYVVFKACEGSPLAQQLRRHRFTAEQVLQRVYALGQAMLEAAEEIPSDFSVVADNLWDGYGSLFLPIDYWQAGTEQARGSLGLCGLLGQLLLKEESLHSEIGMIEHRLRLALRELPLERTEALLSLMERGYNEQMTLPAFLAQLRPIAGKAANATVRPQTTSAPIRTEAVSPVPEPVPVEVVDAGGKKEKPHVVQDDAEAIPPPVNRRKIWRRLAFVAGGACLFVLVFIGCLSLIFQIGGRSDTAATPADAPQPSAATAPAQPNAKKPSQPVQPPTTASLKQNDTTNSAPDGPTTIPNLVGLAREDAEKQSIAAGLHYSYVIEANAAKQGAVFKQEPAAGAAAARGDSVKFWVSKGK